MIATIAKKTSRKFYINRRLRTIIMLAIILSILIALGLSSIFISPKTLSPDFAIKNIPPSTQHIFGTDFMGRDMLARTIKGLSTSVLIGLFASFIASIIALIVGITAGVMPKFIDSLIAWVIDLDMGIPHLILMILISFAVGRGVLGVIIGVSVTHWPMLARVIRAEVLTLKSEEYILFSKNLGKSRVWIMINHFIPHLIPQFIVGVVLLFPHAILHESAITFLGFGLSPEEPSIGIILAESLKYLTTGAWWLAFFPGLMLVIIVILFDRLGEDLKNLIDPFTANK